MNEALDLKIIFGSTVKDRRTQLGISQEELADRAGLHRTYVSDVERGVRNLSLESIEKLARALEISVSTLFERSDEWRPSARLVEILLLENHSPNSQRTLRAFRRARIANPIRIIDDGEKALEFLLSEAGDVRPGYNALPGVILLDLNLPNVGGLEILRAMASNRHLRKIPVIILTESNRNRAMAACHGMPVKDYISKPVQFQNFSAVTTHLDMEWALVKSSRN